jgi:hypothetical protein
VSDEEIVRATVVEIAQFAPLAAEATVLRADVHRIPMAIPYSTPGFERKCPVARSPVPGLVLAIPPRLFDGMAGMVRRHTAHKRGVSPRPE